jgi:hypothetical protein
MSKYKKGIWSIKRRIYDGVSEARRVEEDGPYLVRLHSTANKRLQSLGLLGEPIKVPKNRYYHSIGSSRLIKVYPFDMKRAKEFMKKISEFYEKKHTMRVTQAEFEEIFRMEKNAGFNRFPEQGDYLGVAVEVRSKYNNSNEIGIVVRDDIEEPYRKIIELENGKYILGTECTYRPVEPGKSH